MNRFQSFHGIRTRRLIMAWMVFEWLVLLPFSASANDVVRLDVNHEHGVYRINAEVMVALPPDRIQAGLTDLDHLSRLSSDILDSRSLTRVNSKKTIFRVDLRSCILLFCLERTLIENLILKDEEIVFMIVPARNSFRSGWVRWKLQPVPGGTRILYSSELEPDFWIPPVIGPVLLRGKFMDDTIEFMDRLEQRYNHGAK
ncbi:MAG: hypothetical protein HQL73_09470 [Magnetococcales bacterium]|nr:hypothetical protein [Magnetococcales bacterium]